MDKRKLVAEVARKTNYAKWEINSMFAPLCQSILAALQNGEKVAINEFGSFNLKVKKERAWVDPKTKRRKVIPAKVQVVFTATPKFTVDVEVVEQRINKQVDTK